MRDDHQEDATQLACVAHVRVPEQYMRDDDDARVHQ